MTSSLKTLFHRRRKHLNTGRGRLEEFCRTKCTSCLQEDVSGQSQDRSRHRVTLAPNRIVVRAIGRSSTRPSISVMKCFIDSRQIYTPLLTLQQVDVTFAGCMDTRGFNRGRVSVVLRRKSTNIYGGAAPTTWCAGYAPHARQRLNAGDQFHQIPGRITIQHCPSDVPLACGVFEVEVTALGPTVYSVVVIAGQCELYSSLVGKKLVEARNLQVTVQKKVLSAVRHSDGP